MSLLIKITYRQLQGGFEAQAECEHFLLRAQDSSRIEAQRNVLTYALETLARDASEEDLDLASLFPITLEERDRVPPFGGK